MFCLRGIVNVLSLVAYRVLGNHAEAEDAAQNCLRTVSDNVPKFEHEGAFRCWLVRVLIDEAVTILAKQRSSKRPEKLRADSLVIRNVQTVGDIFRGGQHTGFSTAKRDSSTGHATECSHQKDDLWIC
jgi:DNA-directed RNA polymerase specialized sigma24 family protein